MNMYKKKILERKSTFNCPVIMEYRSEPLFVKNNITDTYQYRQNGNVTDGDNNPLLTYQISELNEHAMPVSS